MRKNLRCTGPRSLHVKQFTTGNSRLWLRRTNLRSENEQPKRLIGTFQQLRPIPRFAESDP
jgi:hypothetical protein